MPIRLPEDRAAFDIIGDPDAANERHKLHHYMHPQTVHRRVIRGIKTHIFGRKGTGKTAIASRVLHECTKHPFWHGVDALPPNYNHGWFPPDLRSKEGYRRRWWVFLAAMAIRAAMDNGLRDSLDSHVDQYLKQKGVPRRKSNRRDFLSKIDKVNVTVSGVGTSLHLASVHDATTLEETEARDLVEFAEGWLYKVDGYVYVNVDNVDIEPTDTPEFYEYLMALCIAANEINNIGNRRVRCLVYLREDFMDGMRPYNHDFTRFEGKVHRLKWTLEGLHDVVGRRLATGLHDATYPNLRNQEDRLRHLRSDRCLYLLLPRSINREDSYLSIEKPNLDTWWYIFGRSQTRPRDLVRYISTCITVAEDRDKDRINSYVMNETESIYSQRLVDDIAAEYGYIVHGLPRLLQSFSSQQFQWTKKELIRHIQAAGAERQVEWRAGGGNVADDAERMLSYLFKMGFIVAPVEPNSIQSRLKWIGSVQERWESVARLDIWWFHPGVRKEILDGYGRTR